MILKLISMAVCGAILLFGIVGIAAWGIYALGAAFVKMAMELE
jgi:hypothetical protein